MLLIERTEQCERTLLLNIYVTIEWLETLSAIKSVS